MDPVFVAKLATIDNPIERIDAQFDEVIRLIKIRMGIDDFYEEISAEPQDQDEREIVDDDKEINVPILVGDNLYDWIEKMEDILVFYEVPNIQWVNFSYPYVDGVAKDWVRVHLSQVNWWTWEEFVEALNYEFGEHKATKVIEVASESLEIDDEFMAITEVEVESTALTKVECKPSVVQSDFFLEWDKSSRYVNSYAEMQHTSMNPFPSIYISAPFLEPAKSHSPPYHVFDQLPQRDVFFYFRVRCRCVNHISFEFDGGGLMQITTLSNVNHCTREVDNTPLASGYGGHQLCEQESIAFFDASSGTMVIPMFSLRFPVCTHFCLNQLRPQHFSQGIYILQNVSFEILKNIWKTEIGDFLLHDLSRVYAVYPSLYGIIQGQPSQLHRDVCSLIAQVTSSVHLTSVEAALASYGMSLQQSIWCMSLVILYVMVVRDHWLLNADIQYIMGFQYSTRSQNLILMTSDIIVGLRFDPGIVQITRDSTQLGELLIRHFLGYWRITSWRTHCQTCGADMEKKLEPVSVLACGANGLALWRYEGICQCGKIAVNNVQRMTDILLVLLWSTTSNIVVGILLPLADLVPRYFSVELSYINVGNDATMVVPWLLCEDLNNIHPLFWIMAVHFSKLLALFVVLLYVVHVVQIHVTHGCHRELWYTTLQALLSSEKPLEYILQNVDCVSPEEFITCIPQDTPATLYLIIVKVCSLETGLLFVAFEIPGSNKIQDYLEEISWISAVGLASIGQFCHIAAFTREVSLHTTLKCGSTLEIPTLEHGSNITCGFITSYKLFFLTGPRCRGASPSLLVMRAKSLILCFDPGIPNMNAQYHGFALFVLSFVKVWTDFVNIVLLAFASSFTSILIHLKGFDNVVFYDVHTTATAVIGEKGSNICSDGRCSCPRYGVREGASVLFLSMAFVDTRFGSRGTSSGFYGCFLLVSPSGPVTSWGCLQRDQQCAHDMTERPFDPIIDPGRGFISSIGPCQDLHSRRFRRLVQKPDISACSTCLVAHSVNFLWHIAWTSSLRTRMPKRGWYCHDPILHMHILEDKNV